MQKATIAKHAERLRKLTRRNHGVLPTRTWLNKHGFFVSYDAVRAARLLKTF